MTEIEQLTSDLKFTQKALDDAMTAVENLRGENEDLRAENDRMRQEKILLTEHNEFLAGSDSRLAPDLRAVKDALGLDFTASVSGEVVPSIEKLRKSDERYNWFRDCGNDWHEVIVIDSHGRIICDEVDDAIDAAMSAGK